MIPKLKRPVVVYDLEMGLFDETLARLVMQNFNEHKGFHRTPILWLWRLSYRGGLDVAPNNRHLITRLIHTLSDALLLATLVVQLAANLQSIDNRWDRSVCDCLGFGNNRLCFCDQSRRFVLPLTVMAFDQVTAVAIICERSALWAPFKGLIDSFA